MELKFSWIFLQKIYDNEETAVAAVKDATDWGYMVFPENYTNFMKERAIFGIHAEAEIIYGSRIKIRLDQSSKVVVILKT